jgi:hypothetical protein
MCPSAMRFARRATHFLRPILDVFVAISFTKSR